MAHGHGLLFFILFSCTMFLLSEIIMLAGHVLPAFVGIPSGNQTLLAGKSHYIIHIKIYIYIHIIDDFPIKT